MIKRRKTFGPGSPLQRKTELRRTGWLKSSGPVKARRRASRTTVEALARAVVRSRSGGRCEMDCAEPATDWHHRRFRSQGGAWSAENGLHLCSRHHQWITEHPAKSYTLGWSVRSTVDPAAMPVLRRGVWVWLTEGGGVIELDLMEIATWGGAA